MIFQEVVLHGSLSGLALAPCHNRQVAGRSQGQIPRASLHDKLSNRFRVKLEKIVYRLFGNCKGFLSAGRHNRVKKWTNARVPWLLGRREERGDKER